MDFYSRMVAIFKVLLPLLALAILATLFLISRGSEIDAVIPFAERDIQDRTRDQQITAPFFSGSTAGGDEIVVTATRARPGSAGAPAEATDVSARLTNADGQQVTLDSDTARVDMSADTATFSGDVRIATSTGLVVHTDVLNTALDNVAGDTPGAVRGTGPFGDITAGQMEFGAKSDGGPLHMLFKKQVKLVYQPKNTE